MAKLGADDDTVSLLQTPVLDCSPVPSILVKRFVNKAPRGSSRPNDAWGERRLGPETTVAMIGPLFVEDNDS